MEGFEDEVIKGAEDFITRYKPIIFLELHNEMMRSCNKSPEQILGTLSSSGYVFESRGLTIGIDEAMGMKLCRLIAKPV